MESHLGRLGKIKGVIRLISIQISSCQCSILAFLVDKRVILIQLIKSNKNPLANGHFDCPHNLIVSPGTGSFAIISALQLQQVYTP